jgi:2Fe-2S ferredoxin
MAKVTFVSYTGVPRTVSADEGASLMRAAIDNGVDGIDADCGGECSCATCHVIVDDAWIEKVGRPGDQEEAMLDLNPDRHANSRLSCQSQIPVTEELDGLIVRLPQFQY